jgi:hypothetical protein
MNDQTFDSRGDNPCLKESSGWFAAGDSFRRALALLSDGAFKLFAHICLEADRRTGRYEAVQTELAGAVCKSRRIVGKYIRELGYKRVCTVRMGTNQYARTCFEIRDEFWPYRRGENIQNTNGPRQNAYLDVIKSSFVSLGCTTGKFNARDAQIANQFQKRSIPLELIQDALLMGACRKLISLLNGNSTEPIASLAYFEGLIAEIRERPLQADYREYLQKKVEQLRRSWAKKSADLRQKGGCLDMAHTQIVQ